MKTLVRVGIVLLLLGAAGAAAYNPLRDYWKERNRPKWRTEKVETGRIIAEITATGTVKPVLEVSIGSFVSGPIQDLLVGFNDEVQVGDVLAKVDPRLFEANVKRDLATLETRKAEVERVRAQLQQAINNENRGNRLRAENEDFLSDTEMDALTFNTQALRAQLKVAEASVLQAEASLTNSQQNLQYTVITSPVNGIVVDRKIEPGQTLAAAFQTPELFIIAEDLRKEVHLFASVVEADMGSIKQAQREGRLATFQVDAYPGEFFEGKIEQVRMSSTTTQNVVTYPVVVAAANPDLKLLPGMTATVSFEVDAKDDVRKIPKAALRFFPADAQHVREEDRDLLDGSRFASDDDSDASLQPARERAAAQQRRTQRHVWVVDGEFLRAVEVVTGLEDHKYSEYVTGDLEDDVELVTGIKPK